MFYKGMPDIYEYKKNSQHYQVFWYEGEFYLMDKNWHRFKSSSPTETIYFDTSDDVLGEMLRIAPFKDWKKS